MGVEEGHGYSRLLSSWWALTAIATAITVIALFGVRTLEHQITDRAVESAVVGARSINVLVVHRNLTPDEVTTGLSVPVRDSMDGDLVLLRSRQDLLGLRVWALSDGRQLYGDVDHREPGARLRGELLVNAKGGEPATRFLVDDPTAVEALAVYLPTDVNGDSVVDVVTELILPRQRVDGSISQYSTVLNVGAALTLLLTLLVLVSVRRRQVHQDHATTHDAMTGLGNRVLLHRAARQLLGRPVAGTRTALLLIDLDGFKGVNDTLGHHAGDELLVAVAGQLRRACRPTDQVIRLGGDEFAVLLPHITDRVAAERVAQGLARAVREPVVVAGVAVQIDASIGIAFSPDHGTRLDELLHRADVAMYDAKRSGGRVTVYDPMIDPEVGQWTDLLPDLRRALTENQLSLYYQPVCDSDQPVRQVEAMLRWSHPSRGLLSAEDFLPQAQQTTLINQIDTWVVFEAARQRARWSAGGYDLRVAVNISVRTLVEGLLLDTLRQATQEAGIPLSELKVEVGEDCVTGATRDRAIEELRKLRAAGVSVAIEGVGGAYAGYLRMGEGVVSELKIHPRLVGDIGTDQLSSAVVSGAVAFAHMLGATSTAVSVETLPTWSQLRRLGCDGIQGRVLGAPMPADRVLSWLEHWKLADHLPISVRSPVSVADVVGEPAGPKSNSHI